MILRFVITVVLLLGWLDVAAFFGREAYDDEAFEESDAARLQDWEAEFGAAYGLMVEGKSRAAFRVFKRLALKGHAQSQHMVGVCYLNGLGVAKGEKRAEKWFSAAVEAGNPLSHLVYAELILGRAEKDRDYGSAAALLDPLVSTSWSFPVPLGDFAVERNVRSRAGFLLGVILVEGLGVEKELERGIGLLRLASNTGDSMASMYLAMAYAKGDLVKRDVEESKRRFELTRSQALDMVQRQLEASMLGNADAAIRADFEKASAEMSERFTSEMFREQTNYAKEILDTENEGYDPVFGRALLAMAAEGGEGFAQYLYGRALALGIGGEIDGEGALKWFEKSADGGNLLGKFALGVCLMRGEWTEVDLERSRKLLDEAAEWGFYAAQLILDGEMEPLFVSDVDDVERCRESVKSDVRARYAMTRRKEIGWLTDWVKTSEAQLSEYRKGADAGYARAEHAYAEYFYWGYIGEKDYAVARDYFQRACDQGHAQSYFKIGYIYEKGLGVTPDFEKARDYYELSCAFGDSWAANNLGAIYTDGELGEKDYEKAMEFYLLAVERGNEVACYNIADAYRYGRGRDKDMGKALEWYEKAADGGDLDAVKKVLSLSEKGTIDLSAEDLAYWMEKAVEMGDLGYAPELARRYFKGVGVPQSSMKAALLVSNFLGDRKPFFSAWHENALFLAEIFLDDGWQGYDPKEAQRICKEVSDCGYAKVELRARLLIARMQLDEEMPRSDPKRGVASLKKVFKEASKDAGYANEAAEAAYRLSRCYAKGLGVKQSDTQRYEWMLAAANVGLTRAKYLVAVYLVEGVGVESDLGKGVEILDTLSEKGFERATTKLGLLMGEGLVSREGRDAVVERLKEISKKGDRRAREALRALGLEELVEPMDGDDGEEKEVDRWAPVELG